MENCVRRRESQRRVGVVAPEKRHGPPVRGRDRERKLQVGEPERRVVRVAGVIREPDWVRELLMAVSAYRGEENRRALLTAAR